MISDRSCDIEDWSNDAENSALINYIYNTIYLNRKLPNSNYISLYQSIKHMLDEH